MVQFRTLGDHQLLTELHREFTAYRNYVEDLSRLIEVTYGTPPAMYEAIVGELRSLPAVSKLKHRKLSANDLADIKSSLERAWGMLRATWMPLDFIDFVTEFNATIPITAYYATYHALIAASSSLNQKCDGNHRTVLNEASNIVGRRLLPWPWSAMCSGGPLIGDFTFHGFASDDEVLAVNTLANLTDDGLPHRLGTGLRTTRDKELKERYKDKAKELRKVGKANVLRPMKLTIAGNLADTTVFDLLYRVRRKTNYEGADVFVLGPGDVDEAERFGASLTRVVDSTVFVLTALIGERLGPKVVSDWLQGYIRKSGGVPCLAEHLSALKGSSGA